MAGGIEVRALGKDYGGQSVIDEVSFSVAERELFVIVGESGCGKSTLLRLIAGLETPDRGEIELHGDVVASARAMVPPEDRETGFVFQSYALWPHMSVRDNVAFPLESRGMNRRAAAAAADPHLATVSLQALADRKPEALSGGQRQRVALARCLAGGARTILMDEPLANLDPHLRATMERELLSFHRSSGATTLYITHDQREAMALADRMAVMKAGRFLQVGTPQEIYDRPASEAVARFIGQGAVVPVRISGGAAVLSGVRFPVGGATGDGPAKVLIRPEAISVTAGALPDHLQGRVRDMFYRGGFWEASVVISDIVDLTIVHSTALAPGQEVSIAIERGWVLPA